MNDLQLSNNLTTIETEIKSYQNIAGQSIFEIGRRLKHVKEHEIAPRGFSKWLENINFSKSQASQFIKIFEEFNEESFHVKTLGASALYQIATLPKEEREKEHLTNNGESKKPEDMTSRELENLKRELKQRDEEKSQLESQLEQAQRSESKTKCIFPSTLGIYLYILLDRKGGFNLTQLKYAI
ncbi:DUF3102 domain-containing protein [Staphylococcus ureilyticus]|uniref:DUF3102 domain-containing protein n=1 Tax=Staphylococcus ureilyticus TaxID=94138 RepID=UPI0021CE310F|nr:DUF3102 domain-containing protein [Staphylococcus ureilyticus]UXS60519.1 DUF3102 domain-containing protein [Staphylococcus ureilyticus]